MAATPTTPGGRGSNLVIEESRLRTVLSKIIRYLVTKGVLSEGLFDSTGQDTELAALKKKIAAADLEDTDLSTLTRSPTAVSLLLLECLQQMPEPLLTFTKYDSFLITECIKDKKERTRWQKKLIEELPPPYLNMTTQLLTLLHRLKVNDISNKLHSSTLVTLFFSVFLRPKVQLAYQKQDAAKAQAIFKDILDEYTAIFGADDGAVFAAPKTSTHSNQSLINPETPPTTPLRDRTSHSVSAPSHLHLKVKSVHPSADRPPMSPNVIAILSPTPQLRTKRRTKAASDMVDEDSETPRGQPFDDAEVEDDADGSEISESAFFVPGSQHLSLHPQEPSNGTPRPSPAIPASTKAR